MKKAAFIFMSSILTLFVGCNHIRNDKKQTVNPIIGDISFINKFGHQPDVTTDNELRITTHLEYVENLLRKRNVSKLSKELQNKREHLLNLLHNYWAAGIYPKNYDYSNQRKPCFIDKDNAICAVGYLIEQTTNRQVAEEINNKHKYDELLSMNDITVNDWILTSGLTKQECAMIQPTYGPSPYFTNNYISPDYGITSSILGGLNISLNTINGIQIAKGGNKKAVSIIGMFTGAGQILLGASMFPSNQMSYPAHPINESQKSLSMINIGIGTTTFILSTWNFFTRKNKKDKSTTWKLNGLPIQNNKIGLAITMNKIF